jgi:hypothetical protein
MNDLINKRDVLELNAYEAIEKRNALLREIKSLTNEDLKIVLHNNYSSDIDNLHAYLAKQTATCLTISRDYHKIIDELKCLMK